MTPRIVFICWMIILFSGCSSQRIITAWKVQHSLLPIQKVMVVGIIKEGNDSLRKEMEDELVTNLSGLGYVAISALQEYGPGGLSDLGHEGTYAELCNNGIDAVLTIALIDQSKQAKFGPFKSSFNINNYYYNRIWNYRNMTADPSATETKLSQRFRWESILFDLSTLEPLCVIQTKSFVPGKNTRIMDMRLMVEKMRKENILVMQMHESLRSF